ncbi:MAG: chemotaxis-specific protein-glutamate methyltransferase CheB [Phycisphaerales bacterium]
MPIRVLVVDDSLVMRSALSKFVRGDPALSLVGTARDGQEGLEMAAKEKPDVMTLDVEMPVLDGLSALRRLKSEPGPMPRVLMCSTLTVKGSQHALEALKLGAADFIAKNIASDAMETFGREYVAKIKGIAPRRGVVLRPPFGSPSVIASSKRDIVLIGSSTGGPPVLEEILASLPAHMPVPIVVAQHMPELFTKMLAERLTACCKIKVVHAEPGMPLVPGVAYICPGGQHIRIVKWTSGRYAAEVSERPKEALYKPSVDELFESAALTVGAKCAAVVLTGMGEDGKIGATALKKAGGVIVSQSARTCAVYGMPRAVNDADLTAASLDPKQIAQAIAALARSAPALVGTTGGTT